MTIASVIPQIWSARLMAEIDRQRIWKNLVNRDYEGEIAAAGDRVKIPVLTSNVTVKDYTRNANIDAPEIANFATQDFVIERQRYYNIYIDNIDQAQARPNVIQAHAEKAARALANDTDTYVAGKFSAALKGTGAADRLITVGETGDDILRGDTVAGRQAAFEALSEKLSRLRNAMIKANVLRIGIDQPWLVIHPDMYSLIEQYLVVSAGTELGGATGSTLRGGFAGNLLGFNIIVSNDITVTDDRYLMIAGTNAAVTYADQLAQMVAYTPELRFGDAFKTLLVYDAKVVDSRYLYHLAMNYTIEAAA